jgi:HAD superfamily hydrolase (TIGR01548 family)
LIVDLAYVEFAEHDLSAFVLELPNAILVRTLSKAWGLAALRVGYAAGDPTLIEWMRVVGSPYPVSGPSVHIAKKRLAADAHDVEKFVARVRNEREELRERLQTWGMSSTPSQGNFVFARSARAQWLSDALASQGIAVRTWPDHPLLGDAIRITTPGDEVDFARLLHGVEQALAPDAILFDMDGVLVDVSGSYREAIVQTAASFGVDLSHAEIAAAKAEGNANNDWIVTQRLLARRGSEVNLEAVTERFEDLYQGTLDRPGLWRHERCLISTELVERLRRRCKLAVVTGRPRRDAVAFVQRERLEQAFDAMVCMEDGPLKPDPFVIDETMRRLGVSRAWFVGDTVDDMTAARAAKLVGIGVGDPDGPHAHAMRSAGAAQILSDLEALEVLLR